MVQSPPDGFVGLCYVVFLSLWSLMSFTCPDYPAVCFLFQLSEFSHSSSVSSWFTLVFLFSFLPLFVFHAFCFFHLSIPSRPWTCVRGIYFWLNRLYFLWFWTMSSCVLWCEPRTFKHAWICADIRNIRKHKHNVRQCKCFRTETCYMRKPNVETTDVIVSLQTCLSHNDESKSNFLCSLCFWFLCGTETYLKFDENLSSWLWVCWGKNRHSIRTVKVNT